ncbi:HAD family phosphatase [Marinomonas pontica]|uniref:HAD family hydrolase n=1 Tax=Marinomonas pontica TaxID=264739 RepID=UPI00224321E8|nr:HAD family phosphatase [Marinomonas pontica]MCW8357078.1 HAD family phosphatase [Marinomonas pontica]
MIFPYKAIIFDCDGVIVDTENISNTILKTMLSECGLELDDDTLHAKFTGFTNQENLINAEKLLGRPLPTHFDEEHRQRFHAIIDAELEPIDGVRELLSKISAPIAMATNARRKEMNFKLDKIQLSERFATRFCVDDVQHGKPAPDLYLTAANALNIDPKDCLVIEDSIAGITAGKAAGMRVLAFSETLDENMQMAAGATRCFKTMKELEGLLGL